ncbi:hypothetical protein OESDEN_07942 [Oesophagostomum dentatum]|uniref:Uncharacterized protein n=1 Tax=Oesophagostomum dentatum TaxID=61180 RepID=A0A0B1T4P1_OESDE|nr:hypothetical protein OESDEN_07942 [Oesophagostomum dentatum]
MLLMHRTTVEMAAKKVRNGKPKCSNSFHNSTVDEFFFANIDPLMAKIDYYLSSIAKLQKIDVQKRRQFKIEGYNSSLYSGSHLSPLL